MSDTNNNYKVMILTADHFFRGVEDWTFPVFEIHFPNEFIARYSMPARKVPVLNVC